MMITARCQLLIGKQSPTWTDVLGNKTKKNYKDLFNAEERIRLPKLVYFKWVHVNHKLAGFINFHFTVQF